MTKAERDAVQQAREINRYWKRKGYNAGAKAVRASGDTDEAGWTIISKLRNGAPQGYRPEA